jgi:hypothetical protein
MKVTGGKRREVYLCERKRPWDRAPTKRRATGSRPKAPDQIRMLQETGGAETADWIGYRNWLTFEDPTCHRNAQCRVTEMPQFHRPFPTPERKLGDRFVRRCQSNYPWHVR